MPKISILMPVFNEEKHIEEAVTSVIEESKTNDIELLIVDDQSTDQTWNTIKRISKNNSFIKIFKNPNKGKNSAFNYAYSQSSGEIIILLAGDDKLPPNAIKERAAPLEETSGFGITGCKMLTFSKNKNFDGILVPKNPSRGCFSGGTIAFTRSLADRIFPIPHILPNEDIWINHHASYSKDVNKMEIPKIGLLYRLHEKNSLRRDVDFSTKTRMIHERSMAHSIFLEKHREILPLEAIEELSNLIALETLRYQGSTLSIVFAKKYTIKEKLKAIVYSNRILHALHLKLYRWTYGL